MPDQTPPNTPPPRALRRRLALAATTLVAAAVLLASAGFASAPGVRAAPGERSDGGLVYGVIVDTTDPISMRLAREAGFSHVKMILSWSRLEPSPGRFLWLETPENDLDNVLKAAGSEGLVLVMRVDDVPGWAGGSPANADLDAVESFYAATASHSSGRISAYEVLNEPNLPFEWGGPPDPATYVEFLKAAYRGVKAGDPAAVVVGGGLSPNTGGFGGTIEDDEFLEGMYAAGARGYFNALGVHNYGGNVEPERDPGTCGICFRRAEMYRALMVRHGDAGTPIWATEFGWLLDPGRGMGQYDWMKVSAAQQADYVVRSYRYAASNWPWMRGMLLSNLDASTSPYHTGPEDGLPWFAILNEDHSPRPAYEAFKAMRAEQFAAAVVRPSTEPQAAAAPTSVLGSARVASTDGQGVNLRAEPSTSARRVALLREGTRVEIVGPDREAEGRTWRNVRQAGGPAGWVAAEYLAEE